MTDLDAILNVNVSEIKRKQSAAFHALEKEAGTRILVLFGAGHLGKLTAERLLKLNPRHELYFTDNNPAASGDVLGIPIIPREEAFARFKDSAIFVMTIFNHIEVEKQLREAGCRYVSSYVPLYRAYPDEFMPHGGLALPDIIFENEAAIRRMDALWADEESRREYRRQLEWQLAEEYYPMPREHLARETYFAPDLVVPLPNEKLVDCGVCDGREIAEFIKLWDGKFDGVAAFEPDKRNYEMLSNNSLKLPEEQRAKVTYYPYAVSDRKETVRFLTTGSAESAMSDQGEETQAVTLDETLEGFHPTFIKMDIEGAEPKALRGAQRILKEDAPLLAICLYHDIVHQWELPLFIHEVNPDYKLYFRRYAQDCWETLCYAVPPSRPTK